jgi:hypothetical protein
LDERQDLRQARPDDLDVALLAPGAGQEVRGRLFEAINEGPLIAEPRFGRRAGMPRPVAVRVFGTVVSVC